MAITLAQLNQRAIATIGAAVVAFLEEDNWNNPAAVEAFLAAFPAAYQPAAIRLLVTPINFDEVAPLRTELHPIV